MFHEQIFRSQQKKVRLIGMKRMYKALKQQLQAVVSVFLEREYNCTTLPGNRNVKGSKEKRELSDYLHNLHENFLIENPQIKISRSQFCKMRPPHNLLACFYSWGTWFCSIHQNVVLKLNKSSLQQGLTCSKMPDTFIKQFESNEKLRCPTPIRP